MAYLGMKPRSPERPSYPTCEGTGRTVPALNRAWTRAHCPVCRRVVGMWPDTGKIRRHRAREGN
jgi:hypothetical protein